MANEQNEFITIYIKLLNGELYPLEVKEGTKLVKILLIKL